MNYKHGRIYKNSITLNPRRIGTEPESPLRVRRILPGEDSHSARDAELISSVSEVGLLHPPLMFESKRDGSLTVVFGHRRIAAASACGIDNITASVIKYDHADTLGIISLRSREIAYGAPLSELEKIIALRKVIRFSGKQPEDLLEHLSICYGRRLSADYILRLIDLLELDQDTLDALHQGEVTTGDLILLSEHPILNACSAVSCLKGKSLSRGKQREAVNLMLYLADQGRERWEGFYSQFTEKGQLLLPALRSACRPDLENARERIGSIINSMNLPAGADIKPPENLEGQSCRLSIRFHDEPSLSELINKLEEARMDGKVRKLLDILKGRE